MKLTLIGFCIILAAECISSTLINNTYSLESDNLLSTVILNNKTVNGSGKYSSDGVLTSIPVNIFKRSDDERIGDGRDSNKPESEVPKKKPKLYSWWMPNMTNSNSGSFPASSSTTEASTVETFTSPSSSVRPTRKPRPTRPPRTRRPTKGPSTTSVSPNDESPFTSTPTIASASISTLGTTDFEKTTSTTEASVFYIDPYGVKRKFVKAAKAVGKVAVKAIGAVGTVAVGTAVKAVGSQVAPLASSAASKAGSVALSAATQVGSYAADVAGRALVRFAASLANSSGSDATIVENSEAIPLRSAEKTLAKDVSTDEGKIVTVYVKHTNYMGSQALNEDQRRKKDNTVYHKEDRMLMDSPVVQEMTMMGETPIEDTKPSKEKEKGEMHSGVPEGAKKIFNKDRKSSNAVSRNKSAALIVTTSLILETMITLLIQVAC